MPDQSEDEGDCDGNGVLDVCGFHHQDGNQDGVLDQRPMCRRSGSGWRRVAFGHSRVLSVWGPCSGACAEDLDHDGQVGHADLVRLLSNFGLCQ